ncbi:hypothetical protein GOP47_0007960 [Adiantum capillus-veneris]|uniref:Polysaccharide biosynthesis domain-containing protein n=1 Tax=Adiantum capillus-veneris TaxID=13818 RepID=A0A9D4V1P8_ADICA|nr:hypothetical protein GOP47_0007960 [Adiantum capillus-veneris]
MERRTLHESSPDLLLHTRPQGARVRKTLSLMPLPLHQTMAALAPLRERICKFWPLVILFLIAVLCFAQIDLSMLGRASLACDVRKLIHDPSGSEDDHLHILAGNTGDKKPLPHPVAIALLHYATTIITPQQTRAEITVTLNILKRRGPCNFLVYGLGHDSPLWEALNYGGLTVFLEEDPKWIEEMRKAHPSLQAHHVKYSTMLSQADGLLAYARENREICSPKHDLLRSDCKLALKSLPPLAYDIKWDVIMIDAPRGYFPEAPGRMSAIYTSAVMAMAREKTESTDILLHDVERHVENTWGNEFLCSKNRLEGVGKLWHFQLSGEGQDRSAQFCH